MSDATPKQEILIIDDERQIRRLLTAILESAGYAVREAETGRLGLNEVAFRRPDAVVLDLGLPDLSGQEVLKQLREWTQVPVIVLSVLGQDDQKIAALDSGADDYLTKPFSAGELLARLRVMLRRAEVKDPVSQFQFGGIEADLTKRVVSRNGNEVPLTAKEYALLRMLLLHRDKVVTHRQLLLEVWGPQAVAETQYLRVYVDRLRQKLEDDPKHPRFLKTALGVGYRLVTE